MFRNRSLIRFLSASALSLTACATGANDGSTKADTERDLALESLQLQAGAPVSLEVNEAGTARVLAMNPRFLVPGHATDPVVVAQDFVTTHRGVFQLAAADATQFSVLSVDSDRTTGLRHVTLNRTFNGIPVFQGGISVHMDSGNNVYRVLGDDSYNIVSPSNRMMLSPAEAALAAGKALGVNVSPVLAESNDQHAVFTSAGLLDPMHVDQKIFHVAQGDDRFAYQTTVSWLDEQKQQQYQLALIDAQDGSLLFDVSLVNTLTGFTGKAFATHAPGVNPQTDTRDTVSFDGNAASSPQGWVTANTTVGNNAVACTDLNANNSCAGGNETQPAAVSGSFNFPFNPLNAPSTYRPAAVAGAFFSVNDYHDRTYALGFNEASRNFQTSNFGLGGAQNDEVQVDIQDGSGTNNANFATPPDGSKPRMQMFLFTINGGPQEDGDLDPGVIYHENTHGLSNRLVGGGTTACLNAIQSGGMGEGWGDFMGSSFLNDPVVGAYVTGNATIGIRRAAMSNSPFTYANIKDGTMTEVHDAGEIWAAALWAVRSGVGNLGAATTERLVVQGMKNTPCNPTMLNARDGIITADQQINGVGNPNQCKLWTAFASRQMGFGASSPSASSTSAIVLSTALPPECGGPGTGIVHNFSATNLPLNIPDNNATGVNGLITVPAGQVDTLKVTVDVNITHTFRGDLVIQVVAPGGQVATLSNRAGGSADNFVTTGQDITASFPNVAPTGTWKLFVRDLAAIDVGKINTFNLHISSTN